MKTSWNTARRSSCLRIGWVRACLMNLISSKVGVASSANREPSSGRRQAASYRVRATSRQAKRSRFRQPQRSSCRLDDLGEPPFSFGINVAKAMAFNGFASLDVRRRISKPRPAPSQATAREHHVGNGSPPTASPRRDGGRSALV